MSRHLHRATMLCLDPTSWGIIMGHVSYVERAEAPDELHAAYDLTAKKLGTRLNIFKAMAHSPELLTD